MYIYTMYQSLSRYYLVIIFHNLIVVLLREAIGSLMAQLQELRSSCATEAAKVSSLRKELQDTSRELGEALSRINRQVSIQISPLCNVKEKSVFVTATDN